MTKSPSPLASSNFSGLFAGRRPPPPFPGILAPPSSVLQSGDGDSRRLSSPFSSAAAAASSIGVNVHNSSPSGSHSGYGRRSGGHASKASNSASPSFHGLHVSSLHRHQERRRLEAHNKFEETQQKVHGSAVVPDGNSIGCGFSPSPRRLGGDSGSKRCLFSCEHSQEISSLSPIRLEGEGVRIPGSPLRDLHSSLRIHQTDQADSSLSPISRHPDNFFIWTTY